MGSKEEEKDLQELLNNCPIGKERKQAGERSHYIIYPFNVKYRRRGGGRVIDSKRTTKQQQQQEITATTVKKR